MNEELKSQQMQADMKDMKAKVDKMYFALMGNEIAQDGGLVGRIIHLEKSVQKLDDRMEIAERRDVKIEVYQRIMWTCVGGVGMAVFTYILQFIFKK